MAESRKSIKEMELGSEGGSTIEEMFPEMKVEVLLGHTEDISMAVKEIYVVTFTTTREDRVVTYTCKFSDVRDNFSKVFQEGIGEITPEREDELEPIIYAYVRKIIKNKEYKVVEDLDVLLGTAVSKEYTKMCHDTIISYIAENPEKFPTRSSNTFDGYLHQGVMMDDENTMKEIKGKGAHIITKHFKAILEQECHISGLEEFNSVLNGLIKEGLVVKKAASRPDTNRVVAKGKQKWGYLVKLEEGCGDA